MPRVSKRQILTQALPHVEAVITDLQATSPEQAEAVSTVLRLAEEGVQAVEMRSRTSPGSDKKPFSFDVSTALWLRASDAGGVTAVVIDGWEKFLAGGWQPVEPVRSRGHSDAVKAPVNLRVPGVLLESVEARAAELVAEKGWRTGRGYVLNARQIATQWLARTYAGPKGAPSDWSENERQTVAQALSEAKATKKKPRVKKPE
ncbi:hypothetical protein [Streptomyces sp. NPDC060001]|uniref:hypothetical protein n=1 Tax=Streptomyces sp. NPDC060001 TaxID=3347032 RepID=UPI0036A7B3E5